MWIVGTLGLLIFVFKWLQSWTIDGDGPCDFCLGGCCRDGFKALKLAWCPRHDGQNEIDLEMPLTAHASPPPPPPPSKRREESLVYVLHALSAMLLSVLRVASNAAGAPATVVVCLLKI